MSHLFGAVILAATINLPAGVSKSRALLIPPPVRGPRQQLAGVACLSGSRQGRSPYQEKRP